MKILVTGADGFVGSWLVPRLVEAGHEVVAAIRPGEASDELRVRRDHLADAGRIVELELADGESIASVMSEFFDAVVHLGAVSSVREGGRDPATTWQVNTVGTALLADHMGTCKVSGADPVLLYVSTAEVYGLASPTPRVETDPTCPVSAYAASKLAGEIAVLEVFRRTGLRAVIARSFAHTGPGQSNSFVVPAFAERILLAKKLGAPAVGVGNLEPVREFLHVADVVAAYGLLLEHGEAGQVYNVASGRPVTLRQVFDQLTEVAGYKVVAETDAELVRAVDMPYLAGDSSKLREATGWLPAYSLEQTLAEVVDAQAH